MGWRGPLPTYIITKAKRERADSAAARMRQKLDQDPWGR